MYITLRKRSKYLYLPLSGSIDLTYRCNNNCLHCWVRIPFHSKENKKEITINEIIDIVDVARSMGCREWGISGGEPMVRPDFYDIFEYISNRSALYILNTNGTLITRKIAKLMRRKGSNIVSIYGPSSIIHDCITRCVGSFEATMRGLAYLREAGASLTIQIIVMRANYPFLKDMMKLARSLSPFYRAGPSWLYPSIYCDVIKNKEIINQRLSPRISFELNKAVSFNDINNMRKNNIDETCLFKPCISKKTDFHVDPYGYMSFCSFVKDKSLRYDIKNGSFRDCWDEFIPSLIDKVKADKEYWENCGSCTIRNDCQWCPAYGYLENGRYSAKVDYLCELAKEKNRQKIM